MSGGQTDFHGNISTGRRQERRKQRAGGPHPRPSELTRELPDTSTQRLGRLPWRCQRGGGGREGCRDASGAQSREVPRPCRTLGSGTGKPGTEAAAGEPRLRSRATGDEKRHHRPRRPWAPDSPGIADHTETTRTLGANSDSSCGQSANELPNKQTRCLSVCLSLTHTLSHTQIGLTQDRSEGPKQGEEPPASHPSREAE